VRSCVGTATTDWNLPVDFETDAGPRTPAELVRNATLNGPPNSFGILPMTPMPDDVEMQAAPEQSGAVKWGEPFGSGMKRVAGSAARLSVIRAALWAFSSIFPVFYIHCV
jgi:hypothetical protein